MGWNASIDQHLISLIPIRLNNLHPLPIPSLILKILLIGIDHREMLISIS